MAFTSNCPTHPDAVAINDPTSRGAKVCSACGHRLVGTGSGWEHARGESLRFTPIIERHRAVNRSERRTTLGDA